MFSIKTFTGIDLEFNIVVNFTKGIGERKGNLLKYVNLYGQFINISETWHVLKSQTAAIMPKRL